MLPNAAKSDDYGYWQGEGFKKSSFILHNTARDQNEREWEWEWIYEIVGGWADADGAIFMMNMNILHIFGMLIVNGIACASNLYLTSFARIFIVCEA